MWENVFTNALRAVLQILSRVRGVKSRKRLSLGCGRASIAGVTSAVLPSPTDIPLSLEWWMIFGWNPGSCEMKNSAIPSSRLPLVPGPAHPPGKHFPATPVSMWGWGCLSRVGWWSRVWSPCWAPRGWGWEKRQSDPETESRTWNICSVGCGRGNLGHRGFLTCCFPYYLSIPLKKSNWACCAIFHNLSMQNCATNWTKSKPLSQSSTEGTVGF